MHRTIVGVLLFVTLLVTATAFATERTPAVGDAAPELHLRDQNGRSFVLHDVLKEREFIVLAFYPKAFTSG